MSNVMEFYAGDKARLGAALHDPESGIDPESDDFVRGYVDFSLHLSEDDLDSLVAAACARAGLPPVELTSSYTEHLAGATGGEFSADVVSPKVVAALATVRDGDVPGLAADWCRSFGAAPNPDAEEAVRGLVELCRAAEAERLDVVFYSGM